MQGPGTPWENPFTRALWWGVALSGEADWVTGICAWVGMHTGVLVWACTRVSVGVCLCLCVCIEEVRSGMKANQTHSYSFLPAFLPPSLWFTHILLLKRWFMDQQNTEKILEMQNRNLGPSPRPPESELHLRELPGCFLGTFKFQNFCCSGLRSCLNSNPTAWGKETGHLGEMTRQGHRSRTCRVLHLIWHVRGRLSLFPFQRGGD